MEKQPMPGGQHQHPGVQPGRTGTMYEKAPAIEAMTNENHNLIQCLNEKLDSVWRYEKYIQDSTEDSCRHIYEQMLKCDQQAIQMLRDEIARHAQQNKFK